MLEPVLKDGEPLIVIPAGGGALVPALADLNPCDCCGGTGGIICGNCPNDHYATTYNVAISGIPDASPCAFLNGSHSVTGAGSGGGGGWQSGPVIVGFKTLIYFLTISCGTGPSGPLFSQVLAGVTEGPLTSPITSAGAVWEIPNCTTPVGTHIGGVGGSFGNFACSGATPTITVS